MPKYSIPLVVLLAACGEDPERSEPSDTDVPKASCPAVTWDPERLDWTDLHPGVPSDRTLTILNTCSEGAPLAVEASVEGAAFAVSPALASVPPGAIATLTVTATLTDPAGATGDLTLATSDAAVPLVTVPLTATMALDRDGDGHDVPADCDDDDPAVFPGAKEVWYDGVDQDCDGGSDFDRDGDGADSPADCDDDDPAVHPGATETWYDGVDQDCDGGSDHDQDRDGVDSPADCADTDPTAHPGAPEVWYDGVDQDCAGGDDHDQDGDGAALGADCADTDPAVFPGAPETWYDGVDQDCDGRSDFDQDGDGYLEGVDDCVDVDPGVHPGAPEVWYDGVDQDCDGASDYDQDGDGVLAFAHGGADCDDTDPATTTGVAEAANGLDDDCDGLVDEDFVAPGDVVITEVMADPAAVTDAVGEWFEVHNVGPNTVDLNGWVVSSDDGGLFTVTTSVPIAPGGYAVLGVEEDPALNGGLALDYAYDRAAFGLGDVGDSITLLAGSTKIAELSWGNGWPSGSGISMQLDDDHYAPPDARLVEYWCLSVAPYGSGDRGTPGAPGAECWLDDDGDGAQYSECDDDDPTRHFGAAEVADGIDQNCNGFVDEVELVAADLPHAHGTGQDRELEVGGIGDFDGDGLLEVAAIEDGSETWFFLPGEAYATWAGPVTSHDEADFSAIGEARGFDAALVTADVDLSGDGQADLAYANNPPSGWPGFAIHHGPLTGSGASLGPDVRFSAAELPAGPNARLDAADFDGDGLLDLVYGNEQSDESGAFTSGSVAIFDAPTLSGAIGYADAAVLLTGGGYGERVGGTVGHADLDGDGHEDLVIGAASVTYVWLGDGLVTTGRFDLPTVATASVVDDTNPDATLGRALDDVDEDGTVDLVLEDVARRDLRWFHDLGARAGVLDSDEHDAIWDSPAYYYEDTPDSYWQSIELTAPVDVDADGDTEVGVYAQNFFSDPIFAWFPPSAFADGVVAGEEAHAALTWEPFGTLPSTRAADLDGNGVAELLFSDPFISLSAPSDGAFGVLSF